MEEELSPEQLASEVFALINPESTPADTAEAPAAEQVSDEGTDTGESRPEPIADETGRLHDPETGKFVEKGSQESESQEGEEGEKPEGEEPEGEELDSDFVIEVDDEETAERVAAVLEKYKGDPSKALVALANAQELIGRKGNEAAQANAELEALKAELQAIRSGQEQVLQRMSQPTIPITAELIENDPAAAAQQAVLQDNAQAFEAAISAWQNGTDYVEANPQAAQFFLEKLALEVQMAEQGQPTPATMPAQSTQAELDAEVQKVIDRHPDLEQHLPAISEAADENPLLKRAMETGTPSERAQALEALTVIAKSRTGSDTSREALQRVQIRVRQEADDARAKARVVSASRGSAATASQPSGVDQFLDEFSKALGLEDAPQD